MESTIFIQMQDEVLSLNFALDVSKLDHAEPN
jgi:hypothetical protein